jgi:hypothetical protein
MRYELKVVPTPRKLLVTGCRYVKLYLEVKQSQNFAAQEVSVTRVIGPFKSIKRLSSIALETDLGPLAATKQIIFYDRTCFESWKILAEQAERDCEPYDQEKAMPQASAFHDNVTRTTLERLHDLVDRHLPAYGQYFNEFLRTEDI